jgi:hypothetical protein
MPDPDGVRQAGRVLRPGGLDRLVERIPQEKLAGFWLDGNKPIPVLGFQIRLQLSGVDLLGLVDDRFRLGGYHTGSPLPAMKPLPSYRDTRPAWEGKRWITEALLGSHRHDSLFLPSAAFFRHSGKLLQVLMRRPQPVQ